MASALYLFVAAIAGFISLSLEILWFRVYSHLTGGAAPSFGVVLAFFLLGLALGSFASWLYCNERTAERGKALLWVPALLVLCGSAVGFLLVPLVAWAVTGPGFIVTLPVISLATALLGAVLPLVSHFGIAPDDAAGQRLSYLYMANIAGSCAGSLLTGFVLLDLWPLRQLSTGLAVLGCALAVALLALGRPRGWQALAGGAVAIALTTVWLAPGLYEELWEKLQRKARYRPGEPFATVLESRGGVITVTGDGAVFGGGVYDGRLCTSMCPDRNLIIRPYALAAVHPCPEEVLLVGLSGGAWAQVLAHHPTVRRLVVVDINPGYLEIVGVHPEVSSLLRNPKVEIVIDDGRRWMVANPLARFDAIVQGTSWHWRDHMTLIQSAEYLQLVRSRLKPGGVFIFNTTNSLDVKKTGCSVFRYGFRLTNCLYLSDSPLAIDRERWRQVLEAYRIDGKPVFDLSSEAQRECLREVLAKLPADEQGLERRTAEYEPCRSVIHFARGAEIVTDDNMLPEWYRPWWEVPE